MFVYILQSLRRPDRYYTGKSLDVERRLAQHNAGENTSTRRHRPWRVMAYFWFDSEAKASAFELYLKSGSGVAFSRRHFR